MRQQVSRLSLIHILSPEQIRSGQVDARSDIYSLGTMFYEMVTGHHPVQADTEHAMMNAQLSVIPPEPSAVNAKVPQAVSAAIMRALAKEPGLRFQTALEFRAALRDIGQAGFPAPVAPSATAASGATAATTTELAELEARLSRAIGPIAGRLVATAGRRYTCLLYTSRCV